MTTKTRYQMNVLGLNVDIEFETEEEFKIWLKAKLLRYIFNPNDPVTDVLRDVLGIKDLEDRVT